MVALSVEGWTLNGAKAHKKGESMKLDFNSMTSLQRAAYNHRGIIMASTEYDEKLKLDRNSEFFKALEQLVAEENGTTEEEIDIFEGSMLIDEEDIEETHTEVIKTVTTTTTTEYVTSPIKREVGKTTGRVKARKLTNHFGGYTTEHTVSTVTTTQAFHILKNCMPTDRGLNESQMTEALSGTTYVGRGDHCHEPSKSANAGHQAVSYRNGKPVVLKPENFEKLAQAIENHAVISGNRNAKAVKQWNELLAQYHANGPVEVDKKQYSRYTSFISNYFYIGDRMELSDYDKDHPTQALARHERGDAIYSPKEVRLLKAIIANGAPRQRKRKIRYENNTTFNANLYSNSVR